MNTKNQSRQIKETSRVSSWDEINHHLDQLSDEEIITLYYQLRDEHTVSSEGTYFPNIKHLHATPFEREKDRREQSNERKNKNLFLTLLIGIAKQKINPASGGWKIALSPNILYLAA